MKNSFKSYFRFLLWESKTFFNGSKYLHPALNHLRDYQRKLKLLIKNNVNSNIYSLLNSLNQEIQIWVSAHNNSDFYSFFSRKLDLYSNKLLWKWAKRRHPRRPNSWIFSKYWRLISYSWKFFLEFPQNGKIFFLKSHYFSSYKSYRVPLLFKVYNVYNKSKFEFLWFNKTKKLLNGLYFILYCLQRGICPFCKCHFEMFLYNSLIIGYFPSSSESKDFSFYNLILFHSYCSF